MKKNYLFLSLLLCAQSFALDFFCEGENAKLTFTTGASNSERELTLSYENNNIHIPIIEVKTLSNPDLLVSGYCNDTKYYRFFVDLINPRGNAGKQQTIMFWTTINLETSSNEITKIKVHCRAQLRG